MTAPAEHLVLVDDEEDLLGSLAAALRRARPQAEVAVFADPLAADAHLALAPKVDALVTDIRMPTLDGIELLVRARRRSPRLPAVIMTAFPSPSVASRVASFGTVEYLDKPFSVAALVAAIERVLRPAEPGFAGALAVDGLPDLVQLCALAGTASALQVRQGPLVGSIWFDRGTVVHAECGGAVGVEAFFEILRWKNGAFAVERQHAAPVRTIQQRATDLLIEALRQQDEAARGTPDAIELSLDDFDDPGGAWETESPPFQPPVSDLTRAKEHDPMASNIQTNLERLRAIDGYIGAALVDAESGMTLGTDGGGTTLNIELAASSNTEVVRAKRKAMKTLNLKDEIEDILITLGRQYHVIRPLRARVGVFYYVALDRQKANLALARLTIADTEKALEL